MKSQSKILIVDDNPIGRDALEELLLLPEYELFFAADGLEALQQAARVIPDLILLDVMMPGMDGYEACRRLRADAQLAEVPVLMVTALDDQKARLTGIEAGADDFISKPYNRAELRARVKAVTRLNRYRKLLDERTNLEQVHNELLSAYDATIAGWSRAMDLRDKETEGHTQRVTEITIQLAKNSGRFNEADLIHLRRGALLHDIGKLGIPDAILNKAAALTADEWVIMKTHPQLAYEMISPIQYLVPALDIPHYHHEKWDGSGYPHGLKAEEIPFAARLFAIVDVWDALTSDRPYRPAWSKERTLEYIKSLSGIHFDPFVVSLFLDFIDQLDQQ